MGSKAALRYANIFERNDGKELDVRVVILTDRDIVPEEMQKVHENYKKENAGTIDQTYKGKIQIFPSDYWTLEYDLALGDGKGNSLACEILQALFWLDDPDKEKKEYIKKGIALYQKIQDKYGDHKYECVASQIMYIFEHVSTKKNEFKELKQKRKPEMAQALATILEETRPKNLHQKLPPYIIKSLEYAIPSPKQNETAGE